MREVTVELPCGGFKFRGWSKVLWNLCVCSGRLVVMAKPKNGKKTLDSCVIKGTRKIVKGRETLLCAIFPDCQASNG